MPSKDLFPAFVRWLAFYTRQAIKKPWLAYIEFIIIIIIKFQCRELN